MACMTFSTASFAQNTQVSQIFTQLSATPIVRAHFQQQKSLASLNKTFVSNGTVLFSKQNGVLWQIQNPVQASLIVTPKKLVQKTQRTFSQIEIDKSPYGSVATLFLQLMSGNEAALVKNFNVVSANYSPTQWNVTLTPKSSLFKKLFVRVDAQGQRFVDRIVITEKANNATRIQFSQHTTQPVQMMASEDALFKLAK
ncbi:LolA family protein [Acinetobacter defluvii]